jgi:hypothetical protein
MFFIFFGKFVIFTNLTIQFNNNNNNNLFFEIKLFFYAKVYAHMWVFYYFLNFF